MKLRNKKTGKIVDATMSYTKGPAPIVVSETTCDDNGQSQGWPYDSLAELNEEWEDYEEPKGYWFIDSLGEIMCPYDAWLLPKGSKEIGNYFESKEEAEKAVEKLKAWKRLKDLGFKCSCHSNGYHRGTFTADFIFDEDKLPIMDTFVAKDLDLLFGGEE